MLVTEAELWELVRRLPTSATVLYLPAVLHGEIGVSPSTQAMDVAHRERVEQRPSSARVPFSTSVVRLVPRS